MSASMRGTIGPTSTSIGFTRRDFHLPRRYIAAATAGAVGTLHPKGFTGGGQIGYNWQIANVVLGAEADVEYLGGSDSRFVNLAAVGLPAGTTQTETVKSRWLATFRGRLGWALDRVLVYATGGLAVGRIS